MSSFHFLRPWCLLLLFPLMMLALLLFRRRHVRTAWSYVCDAHLLPYLLQIKRAGGYGLISIALLLSLFFAIFGLAGPTWTRIPRPSYETQQAHVVLLDMSSAMSITDLSPNRLSRAKFKLHDLLKQKGVGQFALIAYTSEPFVVSPLTDDGKTIDVLLASLTTEIMPVQGNDLALALDEAFQLIQQAEFHGGQILVLSASSPKPKDIVVAKRLAQQGVSTSIIPVQHSEMLLDPSFTALAEAGHGLLIPFTDTTADIKKWLSATKKNARFAANEDNDIPLWRDDGRWFLIPALLFLLPLFRRGAYET